MPFEARPEAVNEHAERPQTSELNDCARPHLDPRPERHPFELQAFYGDVLAELSRSDVIAFRSPRVEKLAWDKVHLAQIGESRLPSGEIPVFDEIAGVRIPFDAPALDQQNTSLRPFAKRCTRSTDTATTLPSSTRSGTGVSGCTRKRPAPLAEKSRDVGQRHRV